MISGKFYWVSPCHPAMIARGDILLFKISHTSTAYSLLDGRIGSALGSRVAARGLQSESDKANLVSRTPTLMTGESLILLTIYWGDLITSYLRPTHDIATILLNFASWDLDGHFLKHSWPFVYICNGHLAYESAPLSRLPCRAQFQGPIRLTKCLLQSCQSCMGSDSILLSHTCQELSLRPVSACSLLSPFVGLYSVILVCFSMKSHCQSLSCFFLVIESRSCYTRGNPDCIWTHDSWFSAEDSDIVLCLLCNYTTMQGSLFEVLITSDNALCKAVDTMLSAFYKL